MDEKCPTRFSYCWRFAGGVNMIFDATLGNSFDSSYESFTATRLR